MKVLELIKLYFYPASALPKTANFNARILAMLPILLQFIENEDIIKNIQEDFYTNFF